MKGILFKEEMFLAVINGRKTQTRRIIPMQKDIDGVKYNIYECKLMGGNLVGEYKVFELPSGKYVWVYPRYKTGEVVYLKEPYYIDINRIDYLYDGLTNLPKGYWGNKLFMPESTARYFIKITHVRCERLTDITADDVQAEGVDYLSKLPVFLPGRPSREQLHELATTIARHEYGTLWESINGKGSWELNPYVWVYEFELTKI